MSKIYGAIEAGGTKFVCAVSDGNMNILKRVKIPTTVPEETMAEVFKFFDENPVCAMGIGSFGPIDVNRKSETYGYITTTPKQGWANYDFLGDMKRHYDIPYVWTTDVNVAAYGELKRGAARGKESCVYLTVGTGVGGGGVINGQLLQKTSMKASVRSIMTVLKDCVPVLPLRLVITASKHMIFQKMTRIGKSKHTTLLKPA